MRKRTLFVFVRVEREIGDASLACVLVPRDVKHGFLMLEQAHQLLRVLEHAVLHVSLVRLVA